MAKQQSKPATDWENPTDADNGQWESLSGAFAPLWKPEKGNSIIVQPVSVHPFKAKKNAKIKSPSFAIECVFKGGSSANFYSGKNNAASVNVGDSIIIGSSFNVVGEDKLVVISENGKGKNKSVTAELSPMSKLVMEGGAAFRLVFNGQVNTSGPRKVNDITVQVPKGYKEKFRENRG